MLKSTKQRLFSATARVTLMAFVISVLARPVLVSPARAAGEAAASHSIAIVEFRNTAIKGSAEIASAAMNSTVLGLIELPAFSVIPGEKVRQAIASKGLTHPWQAADLVSVGQAVGANWVMAGTVTNTLSVEKNAIVELETRVYDSSSSALVVRSRTQGTFPQNGHGMEAWKEAARRAGSQAVRQLQEALSMQGIVLSKPKEGHVRINVGSRQMLRPGGEVLILDHGQKVASGTVVTSDLEDALILVDPPQAAASIDIGNDVRVIYNPPRNLASAGTEPEKRAKGEKKSGGSFVIAVLLLVAAAALLGGHGGGGGEVSGVPPGGVIGPPTVPAGLVAAPERSNFRGWDVLGATTTIRANVTDVNGRPVADGTPVTFTTEPAKAQIASPVVTTVNGTATATLTSNAPMINAAINGLPVGTKAAGICTVTAKVTGEGGKIITATTAVILSGAPIITKVTATPPGSVSGTSLVLATIVDQNTNAVAAGATVTFSTGGQFALSPGTRGTDGFTPVFTSTLSNPPQPGTTPPVSVSGTAVVTVHVDGGAADGTVSVNF